MSVKLLTMSGMFNKIKAIIDEWAPIELLATHCPSDEYDEISMNLSQIASVNLDPDSLGKEIYGQFIWAYGKPTFDKSIEECRAIARKILVGVCNSTTLLVGEETS